MSGIKSTIMNMFAPAVAPMQAAPVPAANAGGDLQQAQPNVAQAPNTAPNGVVPATVPPAEALPNSPLDEFKELWQTAPTNSENTPNAPVALTAEAVQKAVANTNFASGVTPEVLAAITAGGDGAAKAFMDAINSSAQQVMVQSTMVNNKLTEKAVADAMVAQQASLPALLRSQQASSHLADTNPLFTNPAIAPVVEATQAQLLQKYPSATPAEITTMTQNYITEMGAAFAPAPAVSGADAGTDWDKFMNN